MKEERSKIEFDYDDKHYCLEYTASSLKKMEANGFKFGKIEEMVISAPEKIFSGAFLSKHPTVSEAKKHEIWNALKRTAEDSEEVLDEDGNVTDGLIAALIEMLNEAITEITGRGEQGNLKWRLVK